MIMPEFTPEEFKSLIADVEAGRRAVDAKLAAAVAQHNTEQRAEPKEEPSDG